MTTLRLLRPLRALAALAFGVGMGGCSATGVPRIPLHLAFAVSTEGSSAETLFEVREDTFYAINLTFLFDEDAPARSDRNRVWHLVGGGEYDSQTGQRQTPGAPVVLEIVLQRQDAEAQIDILRQKVVQPKLTSWGDGTLTTRLVAIRLSPGRYHLIVRNLQSAPTLRDVRSRIGVARAYMGK